MLRRRSFLGLVGGAIAAPKAVVTQGMEALNIGNLGLLGQLQDGEVYPSASGNNNWAVKQLAKRAARKFFDIERERNEFRIHEMDANTHALRSVSLVNKIRISRDRQFEIYEEKQGDYLNRVIAGMED